MCEGRKVDERSNWLLTYLIGNNIIVELSSLMIALLGPNNRTWWQWRRDTNGVAAID